MNRRRVMLTLAFLAVLALPGSTLAGTSLVNGSFEKDISVGQFVTLPAGSTAIDGWTVDAGSVDWIGTYWTSFDGLKSVDLNGLAPGHLSQLLATTPGNDYVIDFRMAGNSSCGAAVKTLDVHAGGDGSGSFSFDSTGMTRTSMGWDARSFAFTASTTNTLLTFSSTTAGSCGPALDNVSLTEVLPPAPDPPPDATKDDCKKDGWRSTRDGNGNGFRNQGDCVSYFASKGTNAGSGAP